MLVHILSWPQKVIIFQLQVRTGQLSFHLGFKLHRKIKNKFVGRRWLSQTDGLSDWLHVFNSWLDPLDGEVMGTLLELHAGV